jgi:protein SCO1/2
VGLTGSAEEIAAAARAYRVYYQKAAGAAAATGDYLMDHSTIVYLMGPDGAYVAHFTAGVDSVAMAKRLESLVK